MLFPFFITFFTLIALAILHEFGHFLLAKKVGVKVDEFGLGYPPRLFAKKIGETVYSINLLPFGAFVEIHGERGQIETSDSLSKKPISQRALIILGGVISFWIIGIILFSIGFRIGTPVAISDDLEVQNAKVQIIQVAKNSPAEIAGLKAGDTILNLKSQISNLKTQNSKIKVNKVKEVQEFINENKGKEVILTIERGKKIFDVELIPRSSPPENEGPMGISLIRTKIEKFPIFLAISKGIKTSFEVTLLIVKAFGRILKGLVFGKGIPEGVEVMGPVGIGALIFQALEAGVSYFIHFVAIVSLHLAIINLLPIPAVDGGRLLFLGIEKLKGSPVDPKIEKRINAAFFGLLIILMFLVTIKDILRLF
ncbi:site-2 protease family protein [bacterium]|nr:site-2 protease family protein [bacterium]